MAKTIHHREKGADRTLCGIEGRWMSCNVTSKLGWRFVNCKRCIAMQQKTTKESS